MNVVIITNELPHHKYFCVELAQRHAVKAIIHPVQRRSTMGEYLQQSWIRLRRRGVRGQLVKIRNSLPLWRGGWDEAVAYRAAELSYFAGAVQAYEALRGIEIHHIADINKQASIKLMDRLQPDVVVNLGGAIYRRQFIDACGQMLNYHSGLSPLYNGTGAVNFAFANGHIHLCGGTLMTMSTVLDGGAILAHYLPAIKPDDTPATLFMKGIRGAVQVYDGFLRYAASGKPFFAAPQPRPLFYLRATDWTSTHRARVERHLRSRLAEQFVREERLVQYWAEGSEEAARRLLITTLDQLMWSK